MNMKMGDALADLVVDREERAIRPQSLFHCPGQQSGLRKNRLNGLRREVGQGLEMHPRDQQAVAGKERAMVEKGQNRGGLPNYRCRNGAIDDLTEKAACDHTSYHAHRHCRRSCYDGIES